jgi:hypothetical protein
METTKILTIHQKNILKNTTYEWSKYRYRQNDALFTILFYTSDDFLKWQSSLDLKAIPTYIDSLDRNLFGKSALAKSGYAPQIFEALAKNDKVLIIFIGDDESNFFITPL